MNRIRLLRDKKGLTMKEAANQLGLPYTTYVNYEKGNREPNSEALILLANFYNTSIDYMLGKDDHLPDNILPMPKMRKLPIIGTIACGTPITAVENYDGEADVPEDIDADFVLRCKGDSMINARIYDGDLCYIRRQPTVEHGQIAAVMIDDEATLKRVKLYEDHIVLEPENPQYKPFSYWGEDMNNVHILGLAVYFVGAVK